MKKVLFSVLVSVLGAGTVFAAITVEEMRSPETLRKEGYSAETIKNVQLSSGEYNPKKSNKWKKYGFKFWNYFDNTSPTAKDDTLHDIKMYNSYEDL